MRLLLDTHIWLWALLEDDDPADRFLAATAQVYDLVLVTADERLRAGSGFRVLD